MKNLVLPGVAKFTVLDAENVNESDLGKNFFVSDEYVGMSRAKAVAELLSEMNPDVRGFHRTDDVSTLLLQEPAYFSQFTLILATNQTPEAALALAQLCWDKSVPLLLLRSYGLIGSVRLQIPCIEVVESKSETDHLDLRLANPFQELLAFSRSFTLSGMDGNALSHVPWPVLLLLAMDRWKEADPETETARGLSTRAEKEAFKRSIETMVCGEHNDKVNGLPENVREAQREAFRIFTSKAVPENLEALLCDPETQNLTTNSSDFRVLLHAVNLFRISSEDCALPLAGTLPDMTSSTTSFISLQRIFQQKGSEDRRRLTDIVNALLTGFGRAEGSISASAIDLFCKNVFGLRVSAARPLSLEYRQAIVGEGETETETASEVMEEAFEDPDQTPLLWYLALRAVDAFWTRERRWPGTVDEQLEQDEEAVWVSLQTLAETHGIVSSVSRTHAQEIVRYGACELHGIASLVGGVAAQEAVKVLTKQYVTLDNTFIYNGIAGRGSVYRL